MSRRKRLIALLSALPTVRSALRSKPEHLGGGRGPGSVTLLEEHPGFAREDSEGKPLYPFAALERAIADLKSTHSRAYGAMWQVYCEGQAVSAVRFRHALAGLKTIEASPHLPDYLRLPRELRDQYERPTSYVAKKEQNKWIRELRDSGLTQQQIARQVGVTQGRISQILAA